VREALAFPRACVASAHYLASAAGLEVLASGGNAVDAAVATNLTMGVVAPYFCGFGGDLFALVWQGGAHGYCGDGRAPEAATPEAVREAAGSDEMPNRGPLTVTVPGAVQGWFDLLERFGTRSFGDLARPALRYAQDGFLLTRRGGGTLGWLRAAHESRSWQAVYGEAGPGHWLRQPALARTIEAVADGGPEVFYRGEIGAAIAEHVEAEGGLLAPADLAAHQGQWVDPLAAHYRDRQILELPPPTQGVSALEALRIVEGAGPLPPAGPGREHLLIEAMKLALADREEVTDPEHMRLEPEEMLSDGWVDGRGSLLDLAQAGSPSSGRALAGGTAYFCAADAEGTLVSLIQSNYQDFGSGLTVPDWGINLQNRGAMFSLRPDHPNQIAPRKRTLHTLIPALALREGSPWLVFGTMGGDAQAQVHLQLLCRVVDDGADLQEAVAGPRWQTIVGDWTVLAETRWEPETLRGLADRGHRIAETADYDTLMGHAHAIGAGTDGRRGYTGATDPRAEGAVLGI
jgi:gamma-glutamyltranspeptidase / glutathione hydrolase